MPHRPKAGDKGKPPKPVSGPKVLTSTKPKATGAPRKVDVFAGPNSPAAKMRERRRKTEAGDPRAGRPKPGQPKRR